ncbi:MAG: glycosyltransferase family 9 protein [Crocinitomicaceae bacterium]
MNSIFATMSKVYRIGLYGGLGDVLMHTPIIEALKKANPTCKIILYGDKKSKAIFLHNPFVDKFVVYTFFAQILHRIRRFARVPNHISMPYGMHQPSLRFRGQHAIDIMASMIHLTLEDKQIKVHITPDEDEKAKALLDNYQNPVLVQITSISSSNQNWPIEKWNTLVKENPDYTFLQVGTEGEERIEGAVNLLGKTDVRETLALLKNVKGFVAVDSFLNNASNAFLTRGCVLFGPSPPDIWGYPNNINLFKNPTCGPCIDTIRRDPCPYGRTCMNDISIEEVKEALSSIMDTRADPKKVLL